MNEERKLQKVKINLMRDPKFALMSGILMVGKTLVEIVKELPKTPAGKVNRKVLRDRERSKLEENKV